MLSDGTNISVEIGPYCGNGSQIVFYFLLSERVVVLDRSLASAHSFDHQLAVTAFFHLSCCSSGPYCTTTTQPIYCQSGNKSASLVQLSPDALTSHIGLQLLPCSSPVGIDLSWKASSLAKIEFGKPVRPFVALVKATYAENIVLCC